MWEFKLTFCDIKRMIGGERGLITGGGLDIIYGFVRREAGTAESAAGGDFTCGKIGF